MASARFYTPRERQVKNLHFLEGQQRGLSGVLPLVLQNQEMKLVAVHIFKTHGREIIRDPVGARLLQLRIGGGSAQTEHARTGGLARADPRGSIFDHHAVSRREPENLPAFLIRLRMRLALGKIGWSDHVSR